MLKNKKAIYILIPLNIAVWGFFIYRFYTMYTSADDIEIVAKTETYKLDDVKDSIGYKLSLQYADPFLRDADRSKNYTSNTSENVARKEPKPVVVKTPTLVPKAMPDIKYLGLIKNSSSGVTAALVNINGQSKLIKVNEVIEGVTFKSFDQENLTAVWGKEKIVVRK